MIYTVCSYTVDGPIFEQLETSFLDEDKAIAFAKKMDAESQSDTLYFGIAVYKLSEEGGKYEEIYSRNDYQDSDRIRKEAQAKWQEQRAKAS